MSQGLLVQISTAKVHLKEGRQEVRKKNCNAGRRFQVFKRT